MRVFRFCTMLVAAVVLFATAPVQGQPITTVLQEDFEASECGPGTWPSGWVRDANAHDGATNYVDCSTFSATHGKTLRLYGSVGGCWGALAYHPISGLSFPFTVSFDVFNENAQGYGCHPFHGGVGLRNGTSWTDPGFEFALVGDDGFLSIWGIRTNIAIELGRWYRVEVTVDKSGGRFTADFVVSDGTYQQRDSVSRPVSEWGIGDFDPTTYSHFDLNAQENSVWFDNIRLENSACGDGIVDPGEQCDDGNTEDGDCCSSTCEFEPVGSPCADDDLCNGDEVCDGDGSCQAVAALDCDDGRPCTQDSCNPGTGCVNDEAPAEGCRTAEKSLVLLKDRGGSGGKLIWNWLKGEATSQEDFADPTETAAYALCLYAGTAGAVVAEATVPPDPTKWKPIGKKGYQYKDHTGGADGVRKILLKGSAKDKAVVQVKAKGANLPMPELPLAPPVTAQLVNGENGICWEGTYDTEDVRKNNVHQFKAKAQAPQGSALAAR